MTTVAIVQARTASTRFPGKVMRDICGVPLIGLLLQRLQHARRVDRIVVATTTNPIDNRLVTFVENMGIAVHRGDEMDVLDRFYCAAVEAGADLVVRVTGDCPLVDPEIVDRAVTELERSGAAYLSNVLPPCFPDGLDVEVFRFDSLEKAWREARDPSDREHVTPYLQRETRAVPFPISPSRDLTGERWTVDEPEDFQVVTQVFEHFHPEVTFSWQDVVALLDARPDIFEANRGIPRDEGAALGTGQKLWRRAVRRIAGGNMLLSKRPDIYLPEQWPTYFSRARGCTVWDLDGTAYRDVSVMGVGTNILGYGNPAVDAAVKAAVEAGNMSTLNCPEEVWLAERLVELHPWADMVRLARTGGEANAVAVRIARAASGRDKVAICGYHGWHDWYLAANVGDDGRLAEHLLPGLAPNGVPRALAGTVLPFHNNRGDQLENILRENPDVGTVVMEPARNEPPAAGFLEQVRSLCDAHGVVLVFDECTAGFRETLGGLHLKYGVAPDLAIFGKALGNGFAITAVIGRRSVMDAAQDSFMSSTFWSERSGPAAALATLAEMERVQAWEIVSEIGRSIQAHWKELGIQHGLALSVYGLPALAGFRFTRPDALACATLFTQEMLTRGFLAGTSVYASTAHDQAVLDDYFTACDEAFKSIASAGGEAGIHARLRGPVCSDRFKRLN